eukprot:2761489-Amphidinium_carterae.1
MCCHLRTHIEPHRSDDIGSTSDGRPGKGVGAEVQVPPPSSSSSSFPRHLKQLNVCKFLLVAWEAALSH